MGILKRNIVIFFLLIIFLQSIGQRVKNIDKYKGKDLYNPTLKTNPMAMLMGPTIYTAEYRLAFEPILSDNQTIQIAGSYLGKSLFLSAMEKSQSTNQYEYDFIVRGGRIQLTYKYYLIKTMKAPQGLFIGPHFSYSYATITDDQAKMSNYYLSLTYINYNIIWGYQFTINNKVAFEVFSGFGYRDNAWHENDNNQRNALNENDFLFYKGHLKLILGVNVGICL